MRSKSARPARVLLALTKTTLRLEAEMGLHRFPRQPEGRPTTRASETTKIFYRASRIDECNVADIELHCLIDLRHGRLPSDLKHNEIMVCAIEANIPVAPVHPLRKGTGGPRIPTWIFTEAASSPHAFMGRIQPPKSLGAVTSTSPPQFDRSKSLHASKLSCGGPGQHRRSEASSLTPSLSASAKGSNNSQIRRLSFSSRWVRSHEDVMNCDRSATAYVALCLSEEAVSWNRD